MVSRDLAERFVEVQKFGQVGSKIFLMIPLVSGLAGLAILVFARQGAGMSNSTFGVAVIVMILVAVGVPLLFKSIRLEVRVSRERLLVHFFPVSRARVIPLVEIASCLVQEYRALRDYGGYGVKYSLSKGHWSYTVGGNLGVLVRLRSGKEFLIGSQRADEFAAVLTELLGR
jgi:hypothetical protein